MTHCSKSYINQDQQLYCQFHGMQHLQTMRSHTHMYLSSVHAREDTQHLANFYKQQVEGSLRLKQSQKYNINFLDCMTTADNICFKYNFKYYLQKINLIKLSTCIWHTHSDSIDIQHLKLMHIYIPPHSFCYTIGVM